jgi:predicted enzyme related to lactoylglutathione lyase
MYCEQTTGVTLVREWFSMDHSKSVPLEIHELTFDAVNPYRLAQFWSELLGRHIRSGDMDADDAVLVLEQPSQPGLLFMRVPEGKTAKNRIHFDLWPTATSRDAQIERALHLGAVQLADRVQPDGPGWVVFADPEGNEFCIGSSRAERAVRRSPSGEE